MADWLQSVKWASEMLSQAINEIDRLPAEHPARDLRPTVLAMRFTIAAFVDDVETGMV